MIFFSQQENASVLADFIRKASAAHVSDEVRADRILISKEVVEYIYRAPNEWDERCEFNIKNIGQQYVNYLKAFDSKNVSDRFESDIDYIYSMSYRFLCEFDFFVGHGRELSMELRSVKNKIQDDAAQMAGDSRSQIYYASYVMPANIVKSYINDPSIGDFKRFSAEKKEAGELLAQWKTDIEAKKAEVDALKGKLEEYKVGFNFVGLYKGFADLAKAKKNEACWLFRALMLLGVLVLTPFVAEIIYFLKEGGKSAFSEGDLFVLIPLVSIELILIYFFRIVLSNHRSVRAQVMQLELRQTLCQFIQSYAAYSSDIKKQDATALEKFENLIFSGILAESERIPSTFDGLDQIGNFVKKVKGA